MARRRTEAEWLYLIVRVDEQPGCALDPHSQIPRALSGGPYEYTVKQAVRTKEVAEQEVKRLNSLQQSSTANYFWTATRFFPDGGSFGGPAPQQVAPRPSLASDSIGTQSEFLAFLEALAEDAEKDCLGGATGWQNEPPAPYLAAMAAWMRDSGVALPEQWSSFAELLLAGKFYE